MTLFRTYSLGDLILTDYPYSVRFGADIGQPSLDDSPREMTLTVGIEGTDLAELAQNEAALRLEVNKTLNELTIDPGDGYAPASVFETTSITSRPVLDDNMGEQANYREWELTVQTAPHPRSVDLTVIAALATGGTLTQATIDACNVTTGWSGTRGAAAETVVAGFYDPSSVGVGELDSSTTAPEVWTLTRTGTVSFATMSYLVAEIRTFSPTGDLGVSVVTSTGTTVALPIVGRRTLDGAYQEVTCLVAGGITVASIAFQHTSVAGARWQALIVRNLAQTNMPPGTSARQLSRLIEVGGTERTPASLHAFTSSGFLGTTLLHSMPFDGSGYTPDQRRRRVSGNTVAVNTDPRKITGSWEPLRPNPVVARTPSHSLPRGGYVLMAAIKADTVGTHQINWAVKSVTSGVIIGETAGSRQWIFSTAHEMNFVPLVGDLSLPVVRSQALDIEVHLQGASSTVMLSVEEWWLFKVDDDCALTVVNTTEGNLWADSPDVTSPVPQVWVGPNKPAAFHPNRGLIAQGAHTFLPGQVLVTTISDSNDYVEVDLSYYKRWLANAAE